MIRSITARLELTLATGDAFTPLPPTMPSPRALIRLTLNGIFYRRWALRRSAYGRDFEQFIRRRYDFGLGPLSLILRQTIRRATDTKAG